MFIDPDSRLKTLIFNISLIVEPDIISEEGKIAQFLYTHTPRIRDVNSFNFYLPLLRRQVVRLGSGRLYIA
jgi:hypothetical protein